MGQITLILYAEDDDRSWNGVVPEYFGCISRGRSFGEALENLREAIDRHEESPNDPDSYIPSFDEPTIVWKSNDLGNTWRICTYLV